MTTITYEDKRGNKYEDKIPESCLESAINSLNLMGYTVGEGLWLMENMIILKMGYH